MRRIYSFTGFGLLMINRYVTCYKQTPLSFFLFRFTAKVLRKMFFVMSQVWDKGKILSLHEESNLRPLDFQCSTTEPQRLYGEQGLLRSSHDMHPNTARISNVDSIMFVIRLKEMVCFQFSMETEKDVFLSCHEHGTKGKNSESPRGIEYQTFGFLSD